MKGTSGVVVSVHQNLTSKKLTLWLNNSHFVNYTTFQLLSIDKLIYLIKKIVYYQHYFWEYENIIRYVLWKINNLKCISTMDQYRIFLDGKA